MPRCAGASPQRQMRLSLPTGTLRANAFPVPREPRSKKAPWEPADRLQRRKSHQKPRAERARGLSLGPPSPQPSTNDSSRRKRNGHPPKRRRILPKANAPVPPHRGPPRERLPSPANRAAKKAPWEPTDRLQRPRGVFPLFAPSFPEHRREWACALGRAGPFRLHTRRLARRTLLSRAESAHPGALGMPANAKIALIYKNQVRFCFPGWRTFSTPGAPLTALPRAPRCRVRG